MTSETDTGSELLAAEKVTKRFGDFTANDHVDFTIRSGEIHALLGENGAGKSTFVKMIYGLMQPDEGQIMWRGKPVTIAGPQHARDMGIGMVFQHFSLFEALTVVENIQLALPAGEQTDDLANRVRQISHEYGISVDPYARIHNLSVGEQQRVEIMRCLLQDPSLLIMDEPTSVLTPQETEQLFTVLRRFRDNGMAVLFISHKLDEIRALTSRATVLRRGQNVGSVDTKSKSSRQLAEMMVGTKVQNVTRQKASTKGKVIFTVDGLNRPKHSQFATALRDISIAAKSGEILGIAGIAGNGQDELMASLMGEWCPRERNIIKIDGKDVSQLNPAQRRLAGLGFVPEERNGHAAVTSMTLSENALLTAHSLEGAINSNMIDFSFLQRRAAQIIGSFDVRTPEDDPMASSLSGGNLQKFVVGREIIKAPQVLIVSQPTWGVDVGAAVFIRKAMLDLAAAGSAVIMLSQDLEEIFAISHKISVLHQGRLSEATDTGDMTAEGVGLLMGGLQQDSDAASPKSKSAAKKVAPKKSARRSAS